MIMIIIDVGADGVVGVDVVVVVVAVPMALSMGDVDQWVTPNHSDTCRMHDS